MKVIGLIIEDNATAKRESAKQESRTEEKEYVCEACGKAFATKAALSGHAKAHKGK